MPDSPGIVEWAQPQSQPVPSPISSPGESFFWNSEEIVLISSWQQPISQPIPNSFHARSAAYRAALAASGMTPWPEYFGPEVTTVDRWMFQLPQPSPASRHLHAALQQAETHPVFTGTGPVSSQKAPVLVLGLVITPQTDMVRN